MPASTYIQEPPFFTDMPLTPPEPKDITGARVLVVLGDSITTDHISPAGAISQDSPPASTCRSGAWTSPTSTPTAPAGATTR